MASVHKIIGIGDNGAGQYLAQIYVWENQARAIANPGAPDTQGTKALASLNPTVYHPDLGQFAEQLLALKADLDYTALYDEFGMKVVAPGFRESLERHQRMLTGASPPENHKPKATHDHHGHGKSKR